MSYSVSASENFARELKRLAKKYPSLAKDLQHLAESLAKNPTQGTPIGKNCYKIRIAIASKGKGKSGGGRIISCVFSLTKIVVLLSIFDKSEKENIHHGELEEMIKNIEQE